MSKHKYFFDTYFNRFWVLLISKGNYKAQIGQQHLNFNIDNLFSTSKNQYETQ